MAVDYDALKNRKNPSTAVGWKPKPGRNIIRVLYPAKKFLPPELGGSDVPADRVSSDHRSHFISPKKIGRDGKFEVFLCPRDHGGDCPACEFFFRFRKSDDPAVAEMAKVLSDSQRYVMNILDLDDVEKGVQTYEVGPMVRNQILEIAGEPEWGDVMHPGDPGRNMILKLVPANESPTRRNQYSVMPESNKSSVLEHLEGDWADQLDGLDTNTPPSKTMDEIQELVDYARIAVGMEPSKPRGLASAPEPTPAAAEAPTSAPATAAASAPAQAATEAPAATSKPATPPAPKEVGVEEGAKKEASDRVPEGHDPATCDCDVCTVERLFPGG